VGQKCDLRKPGFNETLSISIIYFKLGLDKCEKEYGLGKPTGMRKGT